MDTTTLQANFAAALSGTALTLDTALGAEALQVCQSLGVESIKLTSVALTDTDTGVNIAGANTTIGGKNYTADLAASVDASGAAVIVLDLAPVSATWAVADLGIAFPDMATADPDPNVLSGVPSLFTTWAIADPRVMVASGGTAYAQPDTGNTVDLLGGINFSCSYDPAEQSDFDEIMQAAFAISSGGEPLAASGTVRLSDPTATAALQAPIGGLAFSLGSTIAMSTPRLTFTATSPSSDKPATELAFAVDIALGGNTVTLSAPLLQGNSVWTLNASFDPTFLSLASGFSALTDLAGGGEFALPSSMGALSSIYLAAIDLQIDPNAQALLGINFTVKMDETWNTPIPDVAIGDVQLDFSYASGASSGTLTGTLTIGSGAAAVPLDVTATMPNFEIAAELPYGTQIAVKDLLTYYFGTAANFDTAMTIDQISLAASPSNKTYSAAAAFGSVWGVSAGEAEFSLDPVTVDLGYDTSGLSMTLGAQLNLKLSDSSGAETSLVFTVTAQKAAAGQGWQFNGQQAVGQPLSIGVLINYLAGQFGVTNAVPTALNELTLSNLALGFNTETSDFTFSGQADFPVSDTVNLTMTLDIALSQAQDGTYSKQFAGTLTIGTLVFDIVVDSTDTGTLMIGSYQDTAGTQISLSQLLNSMMGLSLPDVLTFTLNNALYAYDNSIPAGQTTATTRQLFSAQMGNGIDLSQLPVVGNLAGSDPLQLNYQIIAASGTFQPADIDTLNASLPSGFPALPNTSAISGTQVAVSMVLGDTTIPFNLPIALNSGSSTDASTDDSAPTANDSSSSQALVATGGSDASSGTWFDIQKKFGPVQFNRLGVNYSDSELWFLLDAALTGGGLTISLTGLGVGSPLTSFDPSFTLSGLGVDYSSGSLEIGGSLLAGTDASGNQIYSGSVTISTSSFSVTAIGSYSSLNGSPSLFIYAVSDTPLGGPTFCYVTGFAAGFGYNRQLVIPTIDQVSTFPLVQQAMQGTAPPSSADAEAALQSTLTSLNEWIPPAAGQMFLTAGIQFTTYKVIDSFAMLAVSFGSRFRIDILGLSTLYAPPNSDVILAQVELQLQASYVPADGTLMAQAQLTNNSYILSPDCALSGGFAFYCWFSGDYEGEFVLTIGGYHPQFNVPSYYPTVPALGFDWQIDDSLSVSGSAYFALCAHAIMAGMSINCTYASGGFKAWFDMGTDFLISWSPYYYRISVYASLGCSYTYQLFGTHTISISLGASLDIWGPDFGGKASVEILIFTIKINFGDQSSNTPPPLDWSGFQTAFLPSDTPWVTITVGAGLVSSGGSIDVVNPKDLQILTNSIVPSTDLTVGGGDVSLADYNTDIGVSPMDQAPGNVASAHGITITRYDDVTGAETDVADDFAVTPVAKPMPSAMWGGSLSADVNGDMYVADAVAGVTIAPANDSTPGVTRAIDRNNLAFDTTIEADAFSFPAEATRAVQTGINVAKVVDDSLVSGAASRDALLQAYGLTDTTIDLGDSVAEGLLYDPIIY